MDYPEFLAVNPQFPRLGRVEVAGYVDEMLKTSLWPKTSHYSIHGQVYEVTFFWNPKVGQDITTIHPYAAYNLKSEQWEVTPDPHPVHDHPGNWDRIADLDTQQAQEIESLWESGPTGAIHARSAARSLWNAIHVGRREAFSDTGLGYGDIHNFRWQAAKRSGAVDILRGIVTDADDYDRAQQERLYGNPLASSSDIITRAALRYSHPVYVGRGRG